MAHDGLVSRRHWRMAILAAIMSSAVVAVPTDLIDTPWFTRMIPVHGWEYLALALTAVLTGLWFAIPRPSVDHRGGLGVGGALVLTAFAVGCPVCNKIVIVLLGVSGALGIWAPLQPILAVSSAAALATAVTTRWRQRTCTSNTCVANSAAAGLGTPDELRSPSGAWSRPSRERVVHGESMDRDSLARR